ncbi:hypothetical protein DWW90_20190 [Parabacteroides sp. AF17-28]|nr:hypothetical protein DWW90_20190 [Parabacteroides sp. AF17-28]
MAEIGVIVKFFYWQEIQKLPDINYPVPALRRGIAEEQALSKLVNDDLGCGRLFCDPASERGNRIAHFFLEMLSYLDKSHRYKNTIQLHTIKRQNIKDKYQKSHRKRP